MAKKENDDNTTEQYIIDESQEISLGENPNWIGAFFKAFPALHSRNFILYLSGQLISMIGTWLQTIAQAWLVLQITHSAFWVGAITAISSLPILLFSLFGGVIVDRFSKKHILYFTQTASMILAIILGIATITHEVTLYEIMILAFLLGTVNAVDMPARQAFLVDLVNKDDLSSAIALNSGIFNGARIIGPGIAGILIVRFGIGQAFIINGISYFAILFALIFVIIHPVKSKNTLRPFKAIKEGVIYSFTHPIIRTIIIFATVASIFGWSFNTIMPVVVSETYHKNAIALGYLYAASGIGAMVGSIIISIFFKKVKISIAIFIGNTSFAISLIIFTFLTNITLAYIALFFVGFGLIMQLSLINITLQSVVQDKLRGRVMSIYTLMFLGLMPIGSIEVGTLANFFGPIFVIRLNAIIVLLFGFYLHANRNKIRQKYEEHKKKTLAQ